MLQYLQKDANPTECQLCPIDLSPCIHLASSGLARNMLAFAIAAVCQQLEPAAIEPDNVPAHEELPCKS